jgi:hypothetical protein
MGASLTAAACVLALVAEIIPAPIAIVKLIRQPKYRQRTNIALTISATLFMIIGAAIVLALTLGF